MLCCIGLVSEFEDKYPDTLLPYQKLPIKQGGRVVGLASQEKDEMWVFVDKITFLKQHEEYIIEALTESTMHEIIHLCGVRDEDAAKFGVKLVKYNDK